MDYCKGQMRTPKFIKHKSSISGLVEVFVYVCPMCGQQYETRERKPLFIVLSCSETAREREAIAA
jgi:hypothetical protein